MFVEEIPLKLFQPEYSIWQGHGTPVPHSTNGTLPVHQIQAAQPPMHPSTQMIPAIRFVPYKWSTEETDTLLSLWASEKYQTLFTTQRQHQSIFEMLCDEFNNRTGQNRSTAQIVNKMLNMRQLYRNLRGQCKEQQAQWKYFDILNNSYIATLPSTLHR